MRDETASPAPILGHNFGSRLMQPYAYEEAGRFIGRCCLAGSLLGFLIGLVKEVRQ